MPAHHASPPPSRVSPPLVSPTLVSPTLVSLILVSLIVAIGSAALPAQCDPDWQLDHGLPGADGPVHAAVRWDPDGPGPQPERVVFGGAFSFAGRAEAANLVAWNPNTSEWTELAGGVDGEVRCLLVLSSGELAVGGTFTAVGGQPAGNVATTDGSGWSTLGGGTDGLVMALAETASAGLAVGGQFATAGGVPAANVATWNGTSFTALGSGITGHVRALQRTGNGLLVGGSFQWAGGIQTGPIARWDGAIFHPVGTSATFTLAVRAMLARSNGDLLIAGGGSAPVMRWNGSNWSTLGSGLGQRPERLIETSTGAVFAGGTTNVQPFVGQVAELIGSSWTTRGTALDQDVFDLLELADGRIAACGGFAVLDAAACARIGAWDGQGWAPVTTGCEGVIMSITQLSDGSVVVGGSFRHIGDLQTHGIARFDGASWQPLGSGVFGNVADVAEAPNGDLYVAGYFGEAGGVACNSVARWDGTAWHAIGGGVPFGILQTIALQQNGLPIVGGAVAGGAHIQRFDGSAWVPLGAGTSGTVYDIAIAPNGDVIAGGQFVFAGGQVVQNIARWNGSWSAFGTGLTGPVYDLDLIDGSVLYATGLFDLFTPTAHGLELWDGSSWTAIPGIGIASDTTVAPNGDLLVHVSSTRSIVRWDGVGPTTIAGYNIPGISGSVAALAFVDDTLFVGGRMSTEVAGFHNFALGRLGTPCPPISFDIGGGCSGHQLQVDAPWAGQAVIENGSGLPPATLVVVARGLTATNVPLPNVLPQGQAGCTLRVGNALLEPTLSSTTGTTSTSWQLPNDPALGGVQVFAQLVTLPIAGGALGPVAASNAVELRVGAF